MYKTVNIIIGILYIAVICYHYTESFQVIAMLIFTSILFLAKIFEFPTNKFLYIDRLEQAKSNFKNTKLNIQSVTKFKEKSIGEILHDFIDLDIFSKLNTRIHDSHDLIEDTKKSVYGLLLLYLIFLIGSLFIYSHPDHLNTEIKLSVEEILKKYGLLLLYLGVYLHYISWYLAPVLVQKKKNKLTIPE